MAEKKCLDKGRPEVLSKAAEQPKRYAVTNAQHIREARSEYERLFRKAQEQEIQFQGGTVYGRVAPAPLSVVFQAAENHAKASESLELGHVVGDTTKRQNTEARDKALQDEALRVWPDHLHWDRRKMAEYLQSWALHAIKRRLSVKTIENKIAKIKFRVLRGKRGQ